MFSMRAMSSPPFPGTIGWICLLPAEEGEIRDVCRKEEDLASYRLFPAVVDAMTDPIIKESYLRLLDRLKERGFEVVCYDYPEKLLDALYPTYMILSCAESTSNNANLDGIRFGPKPEGTIETYSDYMRKARTRGFSDLIKRRFVIGKLLPSFRQPGRDVQPRPEGKAPHRRRDEPLLRFHRLPRRSASYGKPKKIAELSTAWSLKPDFLDNILTLGNFGGYPSLTLPLGFEDGLPFGVNVTGRIFEDGYVLGLGKEIEELTGLKDIVKEDK